MDSSFVEYKVPHAFGAREKILFSVRIVGMVPNSSDTRFGSTKSSQD